MEEKEKKVSKAYIKPAVVVSYGEEVARLISDAYLSKTAEDKLESIEKLMASSLKPEAKIKFMGDMLVRPKKQRYAISREILEFIGHKHEFYGTDDSKPENG